jgi:Uma2 family endonuclease
VRRPAPSRSDLQNEPAPEPAPENQCFFAEWKADMLGSTMSPATHMSEEMYLRSSFEPDAEFVNGVIKERPPAEFDHANWQAAILYWFALHLTEWNIRTVPSLRIRVRRGVYRVPDVAVLDRANPLEQVVTFPPLAVFEVLSPEETAQDLTKKLDDYAEMGIPHIVVVDPRTSVFRRYANMCLEPVDRFTFPERGIVFEMSEIAAMLQG